jgi:hypothetical protein
MLQSNQLVQTPFKRFSTIDDDDGPKTIDAKEALEAHEALKEIRKV